MSVCRQRPFLENIAEEEWQNRARKRWRKRERPIERIDVVYLRPSLVRPEREGDHPGGAA
jgi:hypothetical protein